jgi:hypothetical protein
MTNLRANNSDPPLVCKDRHSPAQDKASSRAIFLGNFVISYVQRYFLEGVLLLFGFVGYVFAPFSL